MDADDTMEPETIAGQMERWRDTSTSSWWVMQWMGDRWQRFDHRYAQMKDPLVDALLHSEHIPVPALLCLWAIIDALGGLDETLWANHDGDLHLRSWLNGYTIVSSMRGSFVYRRHSFNIISRSASYHSLESRVRMYKKVERALIESGQLTIYRLDLAQAFHIITSGIMLLNEELGDRALGYTVRLGGIRSVHGTLQHCLLYYTIGLKWKERLVGWIWQSRLCHLLGRRRLAHMELVSPSRYATPDRKTYV